MAKKVQKTSTPVMSASAKSPTPPKGVETNPPKSLKKSKAVNPGSNGAVAITPDEIKAVLGIAQSPVLYITRDKVPLTKRILAYSKTVTKDASPSFSAGVWALLSSHPEVEG